MHACVCDQSCVRSQVTASQQGRGENGAVTEVLEQTLWNRSLGVMSEEIVAALVCQIFEGASLGFELKMCENCRPGALLAEIVQQQQQEEL